MITKGVFSPEESLESLDSLESPGNGRILLYLPDPRGSLESLYALESLGNGLFCKDPFCQTRFLVSEKYFAITREQKRHINKTNVQFLKTPLDGRPSLGYPASVPSQITFSVSFSMLNSRKFLGHRPVDPCLKKMLFIALAS